MEELNNIITDKNTRLCYFDIVNMYTNVPTAEINIIIANILSNHNTYPKLYEPELLTLLCITISQIFPV